MDRGLIGQGWGARVPMPLLLLSASAFLVAIALLVLYVFLVSRSCSLLAPAASPAVATASDHRRGHHSYPYHYIWQIFSTVALSPPYPQQHQQPQPQPQQQLQLQPTRDSQLLLDLQRSQTEYIGMGGKTIGSPHSPPMPLLPIFVFNQDQHQHQHQHQHQYQYQYQHQLLQHPECSICLGPFAHLDELCAFPRCHHAFHASCLHTWLCFNPSCPLCRSEAAVADNSSTDSVLASV